MKTLLLTSATVYTVYDLYNTDPVGYLWLWLVGNTLSGLVFAGLIGIYYYYKD